MSCDRGVRQAAPALQGCGLPTDQARATWGRRDWKRPLLGLSPYRSARWGQNTAGSALQFLNQHGETAERNLQRAMARHGTRDDIRLTLGVWDAPEPSLNARLHGQREAIRRTAAEFGLAHDQDSIAILWRDPDGSDRRYRWQYRPPLEREPAMRLIDALAARAEAERLFFTAHVDEEGRLTTIEHWGKATNAVRLLDHFLRETRGKHKINRASQRGYHLEFINRDTPPTYTEVLGTTTETASGAWLSDYEERR